VDEAPNCDQYWNLGNALRRVEADALLIDPLAIELARKQSPRQRFQRVLVPVGAEPRDKVEVNVAQPLQFGRFVLSA